MSYKPDNKQTLHQKISNVFKIHYLFMEGEIITEKDENYIKNSVRHLVLLEFDETLWLPEDASVPCQLSSCNLYESEILEILEWFANPIARQLQSRG